MSNKLLFLLMMFLPSLVYGQDSIRYDYVSNFIRGVSVDFTIWRVIEADSVFKEINLFGDGKVRILKVKDGNWYIKNREEWDKLFVRGEINAPVVDFFNLRFRMNPNGKDTVFGHECFIYSFECIEPNTDVGVDLKIWLSPELGIIKQATNWGRSYREDIFRP